MKKKGFTLIELLAVIVILAIIALIATPIVLNLISRAREGAAKASATSYIKAVETYMITSELDGSSGNLKAGESYDVSELNDLVELKGTKPDSGSIEIDDKRNVTKATLVISGYLVNYDGNDYTVAGRSNDVYADSVKISKDSDTVMKGSTLQLSATVEPDGVTNKTITWNSSDEKIATVDDSGKVTGTGAGTVKITAKAVNGKNATVEITVNDYLANVVKEGDYVAYDAGDWDEDKEKPTSQGGFGGYKKGQSKNASVACYENEPSPYKGWRVLKKDTENKIVTLVHAGVAECYYHNKDNIDESIQNLNSHASQYIVKEYANLARALNENDNIDKMAETNNLRTIGAAYWLAGSSTLGWLFRVDAVGKYGSSFNYAGGYRPVIELKANMLTSGQTTDTVGNKKAWTLVAQS